MAVTINDLQIEKIRERGAVLTYDDHIICADAMDEGGFAVYVYEIIDNYREKRGESRVRCVGLERGFSDCGHAVSWALAILVNVFD